MRTPIAALCFLAFAVPAFAGSIENVPVTTEAASISEIRCGECPPLKPKERVSTYHVEALEPGTQKVEIRDENGTRMIYRTEAWMGGSPVVFVSKAPTDEVDTAKADAADTKDDTVDTAATTGALDSSAADSVKMAEMGGSRQFDPSRFELRLN